MNGDQFVLFIEIRGIISILVENQFVHFGLWLASGCARHLIFPLFLDTYVYVQMFLCSVSQYW